MAAVEKKIARRKDMPHNTEAEKTVLGAMLRSATIANTAIASLTREDFFEGNERHRVIFDAMFRVQDKNSKIDVQTVVDELINSGTLEQSGGIEYLTELVEGVVTLANIEEYINIVKDQSLLRRFLQKMEDTIEYYFTHDIKSISEFVGESEKELSTVAEGRRVASFQTAKDISEQVSKDIETLKVSTTDDEVTGVPTGFPKMNRLTHGWHEHELIVVAARTGVGKTALSLNLAYNAALREVPVAYFSLEMGAKELWKRLIAADSGVEHDHLITGFHLNAAVKRKLQESCSRLARTKIYVDDTSSITILDIVAKCRNLKNHKEPNLGLIVVDYIGLVSTGGNKKFSSRQEEVQYVSQTLKNLAKELHVPVIAVAQLNRKVEDRGSGEPQISDLRESGSIEQDADIIMLMSQSKVSETGESKSKNVFEKQNNEVAKLQNQIAENEGGAGTVVVKVNIAKNRAGSTGNVPLLFRKAFCKFDSLSQDSEQQIEELERERVSYLGAE